ncbi:uncharacterized protein THITE_153839 [Thermothielavioides terrestris NRRL 8126]|uniref:Uncharacterized protein n=1 Tax=Thermothielavioides terrestris (strain ATCC 38088 / NRRL 8126) TaxID=578455 RepID=G2QXL6_THETT|nr:uncharacterized protein THITE_153839 [Thermothielavioides terrestris NRRL 8126]AEO62334.1 hypothetical protein THITE_153839 [Thermothielavioides terrestris NRRL 8126]
MIFRVSRVYLRANGKVGMFAALYSSRTQTQAMILQLLLKGPAKAVRFYNDKQQSSQSYVPDREARAEPGKAGRRLPKLAVATALVHCCGCCRCSSYGRRLCAGRVPQRALLTTVSAPAGGGGGTVITARDRPFLLSRLRRTWKTWLGSGRNALLLPPSAHRQGFRSGSGSGSDSGGGLGGRKR